MILPEFKVIGAPELLMIIAFFSFLLIVINYLINYLPIYFLKSDRINTNHVSEPVSIVICAKNEDDNLTEFLPKIMTQVYPNFEVVVVNDCSFDNTENVIDEFSKVFPNLRKANIKEDDYYKHGKKFAMLVGIKAAKYNRIVFTDADCYPASNSWLSEMVAGFSDTKEIVLGYGAYQKKPGFLNKLIRFDTFIIAVQFLSSAIKNKPYMGVGRNLAYTKELFFKVKGFSTHYHIISGDDDLFINQSSNKINTNVCINKDAITYSVPKSTLKNWRIQKARHLSSSSFLKSSTKFKILFSFFSQYFFYFSLFSLIFFNQTLILIPILFVLKVVFQWIILNKASKILNERDLLLGSVLFELILLFLYPFFYLSKLIYKPNKWTV